MNTEDCILSEMPIYGGSDIRGLREVKVIACEDEKVYDGTHRSSQIPRVIGEFADDHIAIVTQRFKEKHAGETMLVPEIKIIDRSSGRLMDYVVVIQPASGRISQRPLMIWAESDTKEHDGTILSMVLPQVDNLAHGDTAIASQAFDTPEIGIRKALTPTVDINDGNGGRNYEIIAHPVDTGSITPLSAGARSDTMEKIADYLGTDDFVVLTASGAMDFLAEVCYADDKKVYLKLEARKRVQMVVEMERIHQGLHDAEVGKKLHMVVKGTEVKAQPSGQSSSSPTRSRHGR